MRKAAYCSIIIVLLMLTWASALQEIPDGTLTANATDTSAITFTIVNSGGDPAISDVTVSGAVSGISRICNNNF